MQPDVGEAPVADVLERADDSVEEGLGADEAVVGEQVGAKGEMLARAEADLEMERPGVAEQSLGGHRPLFRHAHRRQQPLEQLRLAGAQLVARAAAVEAAEGSGIVHLRPPSLRPPDSQEPRHETGPCRRSLRPLDPRATSGSSDLADPDKPASKDASGRFPAEGARAPGPRELRPQQQVLAGSLRGELGEGRRHGHPFRRK